MQSKDSTIGDVTRYWIYAAKQISSILPQISGEFSNSFLAHVAMKYNCRAVEMDNPICRLCLLLDNRYKCAVNASYHVQKSQLRRTVSST